MLRPTHQRGRDVEGADTATQSATSRYWFTLVLRHKHSGVTDKAHVCQCFVDCCMLVDNQTIVVECVRPNNEGLNMTAALCQQQLRLACEVLL